MYYKIFLFIGLCIFVSCKSQNTNHDLKLISAEQEHWIGGVKGAEGYRFILKLDKPKDKQIKFLGLQWQGEELPVTYKVYDNYVEVEASYSMNSGAPQFNLEEEVEADEQLKQKPSYLKYRIGNQEDSILISKFTQKEQEQPLFP